MEFSTEFGGFQNIHRFPSEFNVFSGNPPNLVFIRTSIDALEDMIKEESEIKVRDTSHNAISIGEVGQELFLLTKSLYFPPNYLRNF